MLPGESFAAAVRASLERLGPGWSVFAAGAGTGLPLDDAGSLLLAGPDLEADRASAEAGSLSAALTAARNAVAEAVAAVSGTQDGERALPTTLGGPAVWERVCTAAASAGVGMPDPHAVVIVRTERTSDRTAERAAAALRRTVRDQDVVCRLDAGTYAVLALCWPPGPVAQLADRLVAALLDVGVGAAAGAAVGPDPHAARPDAAARAERAWSARQVLPL